MTTVPDFIVPLAAQAGWSTADKAAVASAAAAGVAALASWASVIQGGRMQRRALEPRLHIQVSEEYVDGGGQNRIHFRVENTGGGFAQEVMFWVQQGRAVCMGGLPPHGSLGPGRGVSVMTGLQPVRGQRLVNALVFWRYGTKTDAQAGAPSHRKIWSRRKWAFWAPKNHEQIVHRFFRDAGPLSGWQLVKYQLEE